MCVVVVNCFRCLWYSMCFSKCLVLRSWFILSVLGQGTSLWDCTRPVSCLSCWRRGAVANLPAKSPPSMRFLSVPPSPPPRLFLLFFSRSFPTGASAGVATRAVGRARPSAAGGVVRPLALGQGPEASAAGAVDDLCRGRSKDKKLCRDL